MVKKSSFSELLAIQVAGGQSIKLAAGAAGCSVSQAYHLSSDPTFSQRVAEIRTQSTSQAVGKLSNAASLAVDTLVKLLDSEEPKDRLNAAKAILASLVPMSEFGELRSRIDDLEKRQLRVA